MPFTATELSNIFNSTLPHYMGRGEVYKQAIQAKPLLAAFDGAAGTFPGGKDEVSLAVKSGGAGGRLQGYTHDDQVTYYNPATTRRIAFPWREHHIGIGVTHTELKVDGITVTESGADQSTSDKDGREEQALANLLEEKMDDFNEDYAASKNSLLWGDGTSDTKAIAGVRSFILDNPASGSTGGLNRTTNTWWRNRAATTAANSAGTGFAPISSAATGGGVLLQFLQEEQRQLRRYAQGAVRHRCFAGSAFLAALEKELRANGKYTETGFRSRGAVDGSMDTESIPFGAWNFVYDPSLDDLSLSKRCYIIDMRRIRLLYMSGEKMKRSQPARPYDRYVMYSAITTTGVMVAQQLNTSAVYDIA